MIWKSPGVLRPQVQVLLVKVAVVRGVGVLDIDILRTVSSISDSHILRAPIPLLGVYGVDKPIPRPASPAHGRVLAEGKALGFGGSDLKGGHCDKEQFMAWPLILRDC